MFDGMAILRPGMKHMGWWQPRSTAQCLQPGASVAAVAMSHRINANVVRKWLPRYSERPGAG